ncbi:hypothetical protein [Desulfovibrio piger]|uniref:hypothetical protein n=1 Tax=Desulfovibrio piger TaxID=901 RepID=UPI0026EAD8B4|nr:hypothetical protein [Desulfovibrio piger]
MAYFSDYILEAFKKLYTNDSYLLASDSTEASLQFRIALYLAAKLENNDLNIDCEYNTVNINNTIEYKECSNTKHARIDIIYHKRGTSDKNIFVIELKKKSQNNTAEKILMDKLRVKYLVSNIQYRYKEGYSIYNISKNGFSVYYIKRTQDNILTEGDFTVSARDFRILNI